MLYEAFLIHLEPKTLGVLSEMIYANVPREDFVIETELMNLANEIRARLEKLTNGINPQPVAEEEPLPRYQCMVAGCPGNHVSKWDVCPAPAAEEPDWLKC